VVLACGLSAAAISLASWQHRPGLPAFAAAGVLAWMGLRQAVPLAEFWPTWMVNTLWVMGAFLAAYGAAWAVDTRIVFAALPQQPPPKEVNPRLLLTRLLPCGLLTGAAGWALLAWGGMDRPLGPWLGLGGFGLGAALGARLFRVVSTIWVTFGVLWALGAVGLAALARGGPGLGGPQGAIGSGWSPLGFMGASVGSALVGYWVARPRRREDERA
jgi:hypothetical protein